jgi:serine protease Do
VKLSTSCQAVLLASLLAWSAGAAERHTPVVKAVQKVGPSVVNISTETLGERAPRDFFDPFFLYNPYRPRYYKQTSIGSGLIFDADGYLVTNAHVVEKAVSKIRVSTSDEQIYEAQLVGSSSKFDVAILKITPTEGELPFQPLGCSDDLLIGETVIAIGNPMGLSHTVTQGIISALNRSFQVKGRYYREFIQTDASINPGNSGGPLLNINGEVIGINTAIYENSQGIGFAIPIDMVRKVVNDVMRFGEARSPWFGLHVQDLTPALREYFNYTAPADVIVSVVFDDSPAAAGGVREDDIIISLNGKPVVTVEDYRDVVGTFSIDENVTVRVWRNGQVQVLEVAGGSFPPERIEELVWNWLGFKTVQNSPNLARQYRLPAREGLVISEVRASGRAAAVGLEPGDILWQINNVRLKSIKEFQEVMVAVVNQNLSEVSVVVQRGQLLYYLTL